MRPTTVVAVVFVASGALAAVIVAVSPRTHTPPAASASLAAPPAEEPSPRTAAAARSDASPAVAPPPALPPPALTNGCPPDAVRVEGDYCPFVAHRCAKSRKARAPGEEPVCERYQNEVLCEGAPWPVAVCVDRFEYPNRAGVLPAVLSSFDEAAEACEREHKRLCTVAEWRLACEGAQIQPYPVGLERTAGTCQWDAGEDAHVAPTRGARVAATLAERDHRAPAGARGGCASPFGVMDLGGNVREWTVDPTGSRVHAPFTSVVAGGSWGPGLASCRAADDGLPPPSRAATIGFRCCVDVADPTSRPKRPGLSAGRKGFRPILPTAGLP